MIYLQILVTIFIVFALSKLFFQKQKNKISWTALLFWSFLWLVVLIVFWEPEITSYLANILGIGRGADLVLYLSVILIFYLLFRIFVRLNRIESDITKLVRSDALKNVRKR
ncbi:MAG: DUF2304 family protein [Patescibacteria group bacterium]|nr:DUF2304 family protein [Patescibacteria group bacterium]